MVLGSVRFKGRNKLFIVGKKSHWISFILIITSQKHQLSKQCHVMNLFICWFGLNFVVEKHFTLSIILIKYQTRMILILSVYMCVFRESRKAIPYSETN